ncbi:rRNA processing protein, Fcf1 family protein [Ceratobasidium sp. AG-Ba]|nr:rRNA processing protein, Fcf1 family protein [Ceratobasidium sp. AG-Ba]
MRQKRTKAYKKLMALYHMSFGFRQPYQVLVDSTFCLEVFQHKIDPLKQLCTVLQGECKLMITQCSMVELYKLGPSAQPVVDMAKGFERRRCNHREAVENEPCVEAVVGETNKHRYVVASQSTDLRNKLRKIPAVPMVHINRSVMVLEPVSDATLKAKNESDVAALGVREPEAKAIASTSAPVVSPEPVHRRKVAKGPNPLSVKKKKKPEPLQPNATKQRPKPVAQVIRSQKRTRDISDDEKDISENKVDGSGGHKRKRRRKHTETPSG